MSDIFCDDDLVQLYETGIQWIRMLWIDHEIVNTEIKAKTVGRNRSFVLIIVVRARVGERALQRVRYYVKIQTMEFDMIFSHWILKEMKCGPEKCFFCPIKVSKKNYNEYFLRNFKELGMITEEVAGLLTARDIGKVADKAYILNSFFRTHFFCQFPCIFVSFHVFLITAIIGGSLVYVEKAAIKRID